MLSRPEGASCSNSSSSSMLARNVMSPAAPALQVHHFPPGTAWAKECCVKFACKAGCSCQSMRRVRSC
jgi:hypothetical protein